MSSASPPLTEGELDLTINTVVRLVARYPRGSTAAPNDPTAEVALREIHEVCKKLQTERSKPLDDVDHMAKVRLLAHVYEKMTDDGSLLEPVLMKEPDRSHTVGSATDPLITEADFAISELNDDLNALASVANQGDAIRFLFPNAPEHLVRKWTFNRKNGAFEKKLDGPKEWAAEACRELSRGTMSRSTYFRRNPKLAMLTERADDAFKFWRTEADSDAELELEDPWVACVFLADAYPVGVAHAILARAKRDAREPASK